MKRLRQGLIIFLLSLAMLEGMLRLAEPRLAMFKAWEPPDYRNHHIAEVIDGRSGDLYHLTCMPYAPEIEAPYAVDITYDANGFRGNPAADVVVIGDSFVVAESSPAPFWSAVDAYAIAQSGIGPDREMALLREYAFDAPRKVVVWAYFEGNDLTDKYSSTQPNAPFMITRVLQKLREDDTHLPDGSTASGCVYPITGRELAFYWPYVFMLTHDRATLTQRYNWSTAMQTILKAAELTQRHHATFVLMLIPSKPSTYYDMLTPEHIAAIAAAFGGAPDVPELFFANADTQRTFMREFAEASDIPYLDLTDVFRTAARTGEILYFRGDTHWNRAGHTLTGETLAAFLVELD